MKLPWKAITPIIATLLLAVMPVPSGLSVHAWYYFSIFVGVIVGIILEPLPGGAIGLIGVTVVTILSPWVLYSPEELAKPGFNHMTASLNWALSGFSNGTVWLIFAAFMFSLGYAKTGLGKRIALHLVKRMGRRTLLLGYAVMLSDAVLGPFTPSVTARSAGTIYPLLYHLPMLYGSKPNDPSARKIGSYIMWVAVASTCATSSLFLTALAPNLLALEIVKSTTHLHFSWMQWFYAAAPMGIFLLLAVPLLAYWFYKPELTEGDEVPKWAAAELIKKGPLSRSEGILAGLVMLALALWVCGEKFIDPTTAALGVIGLMVITAVVTWDDILKNAAAWNTLVWFATLVALAAGLGHVGFIVWFAAMIGQHIPGLSPTAAILVLLAVFFYSHYMFASITAHVTAILPVILALGISMPAVPIAPLSILLCLTLGIMGVLTPYASGPNPVYYGSGYLPSKDFWRLGGIFGVIFFATFMLITVPWVLCVGQTTFLKF